MLVRTHEYPRSHWQHHRRNLGCAGFFCLPVLSMACRPHREQARSHRGWGCSQMRRPPQITCGSELAREGGGSACIDVECDAAIASRLAPTGDGGVHRCGVHHRSSVGASLLAKAVGQLASMLNVTPSSRAGSLPQGMGVFTDAASTTDQVWERACSRRRWVSLHRC